jgi:hypothetical protein
MLGCLRPRRLLESCSIASPVTRRACSRHQTRSRSASVSGKVVPGADVGGDRLPIEVIRRVPQQKASPLHVGVREFKQLLHLMVGARDRVESPLRPRPYRQVAADKVRTPMKKVTR